jgi:branched-chain amino acid transport system substrate-binding protein
VKSQEGDHCENLGGAPIGQIVLFGTPPLRVALTPKTIPFYDKYVEKFRREPVYTSFGAYDALYIYKEAVERARTFDPERVIPQLERTNYVGTGQRIAFDEAHDLRYGPGYARLYYVQWQDGCKRALIWPKEVATGKYVPLPWMR